MAVGVRATQLTKPAPAQAPPRIIHLYGLTRAPGPSAALFRRLRGVDGDAGVEPVSCGEMVCWVSRVPETDFATDLAKNMQNLDWLAGATTRHQEVVSAIAEAADILPARFGIEFLNEKSLCADIERRKSTLQADFRRIHGKQEWGVKVFALPAVAPPTKTKKIRSGKEYLQAKSALVRKVAGPSSLELALFAKKVESLADEVAEGGKFAAARRDLEFHRTILLKRADRKKLETLSRTFSKKWRGQKRIELTGPWPPFSFVSRSDSSD